MSRRKKLHIWIYFVLVAVFIMFVGYILQNKTSPGFADTKKSMLSLNEAIDRTVLQLDLDMEKNPPLWIRSNSNNNLFVGYVLSVDHLDTQVTAIVLYSLPIEPESKFYKFQLSEFIVDDLAPNGTYRESIHEIYTIDRYDGTVTTLERPYRTGSD